MIKYKKIKDEKERVAMFDRIPRDPWALNQEAYSAALTDTLRVLAYEDVTSHGRLIEIIEVLSSFTSTGELTAE